MNQSLPIRFAAWALLPLASHSLSGQMHKVEKPEKVTRAIGVYEWTGDLAKPTAARLVPVSLFLEGHFEDAGVYLAQPVPFTLQTGDVYSVERAGESLGTFDVEYARDIVTRHAAADDDPVGAWYGYGVFAPPAPPKPSTLHASATKAIVAGAGTSDDDEPHFVVRAGAEDTTPPKLGDRPSDKTSAGSTPNPAPDDDPDRPTLRHRDAPPPGKAKRPKDSGSVVPLNTSLNDDPDRPTLRRGTPEGSHTPNALSGLPPTLHQAVAVSDASHLDPHLFARDWDSPQERQQTLAAVQALARPLAAKYLIGNKLQPVAAAAGGPGFSAPPKLAAGKPAAQRKVVAKTAPAAPEFVLSNEQLKSYLLSYGGLPTFIYTAEVPVAAGGPVYLTMVAQRLPTGDLQVGLSSVTDATHMDRTPWMRPIDVVDPDDSHRASILMELRGQSSRQFALYRFVTAQAEQEFVTGLIE